MSIDGAERQCGAGAWGDIAEAPVNVYVDASAAPGGDGSTALPVQTLAEAMSL